MIQTLPPLSYFAKRIMGYETIIDPMARPDEVRLVDPRGKTIGRIVNVGAWGWRVVFRGGGCE